MMPFHDLEELHPSTSLRIPTEDQIDYAMVVEDDAGDDSVPVSLRAPFLSSLGQLPKSGIQLIMPAEYQYISIENHWAQPIRFGIVFDSNFIEWNVYSGQRPALLRVLFWLSTNPSTMKVLSSLLGDYLIVPGTPKIREDMLAMGVSLPIISQLSEIEHHVKLAVLKQTRISESEFAEYRQKADVSVQAMHQHFARTVLPFRPLHVNLSQLRQIFGQFDDNYWQFDKNNDFSRRIQSLIASFDAVSKSIEWVSSFQRTEKSYYGWQPAAIVAFPSDNPAIVKAYSEALSNVSREWRPLLKKIRSIRFAEQNTTTYEQIFQNNTDKNRNGQDLSGEKILEAIRFSAKQVVTITDFMDVMGYLHGSFYSAPYLRLPLKGKSLSMHHAPLAPGNYPAHAMESVKNGLTSRFSEAITDAVHEDFRKLLYGYRGGIVALSDLPVEWLQCEGVPLSFLKDICRIPEGSLRNIMSQFSRNVFSTYSLTSATISRALIICGAPDGDIIRKNFDKLSQMWKKNQEPWHAQVCNTVAEATALVKDFRPEILIFDTHGRFLDNQRGSEIQIGKEYLTGKDVVSHFPQVPLVIMSTCWGAPLYGCSNTIAHAFFEAGTFSVVTSMLPIDIFKGAALYTRMLNNLKHATKSALHANWSAFISHNLRTSLFDDMVSRVRKRYLDKMIQSDYLRIRTEWQIKTMIDASRAEAYRTASEMVSKCFGPEVSEKTRNLFETKDYTPEFMHYCVMGRADLIQFKSWNDEKHEPNPENITIEKLFDHFSHGGKVDKRP